LDEILEPGRIELVEMDNTSRDSDRTAANVTLQKTNYRVNILVNSTGIIALPKLEYTKDGFEIQFGVNRLARFLLFELLKPALEANASPESSSRVVNLSSSAHYIAGINQPDDYNFEKSEYNDWVAFGQSKTAKIYIANNIDRYYRSRILYYKCLS